MEGEQSPSDRDWLRIGLVVGCLLAVVAVSFLVPAFATDGLAGSPVERLLPGEGAETDDPPASGFEGAGGGSGLGALNPGDTTGVGGDVGLDSDTYATTDTEVHFTVESTRATYWRTGTFDSYTGAGWERTGDVEPLDGAIDHAGPDGEQIDYEVTLEKSATAVPTAWRPSIVEGVENPLVTDSGAVRTEAPLEPGTTIQGVSFAPQDDVAGLQAAEGTPPEEIQQRYTQLPEDTPDRIGTHTQDVIDDAGAEGTYEEAVAIQEWLRSSKEYDLGVSQRSENIADTFIFEMEAGYCEYFATAMVTMLRSQDIPSRYVVGYSTGQQVDDGVYEVRGMNAHAWVEVYFEEAGWVRFDPTPGNQRLATQQDALEDVDGEFDLSEPGSPGEEFEPADEEEETPSEGLVTSLNRTAVPGEAVEVTVTVDEGIFSENRTIGLGEAVPLPGVEVLFNGEPVGITDEDGTVVGTVPDADELEIRIREGDDTTPEIFDAVLFDDKDIELPPVNGSDDSDALTGASLGGTIPTTTGHRQTDDGNGSADTDLSETHPIERTARLTVSGEPAPGAPVSVTARVGDVTLREATIRVDGEVVGETDGDGELEFELPERTGELTVSAERGSISGETTVTIPELTMTVETGRLGAYAFGSATVTVELDDESAAGVPVLVDGEEVAATGTDGTATIRLPVALDATVSAEMAGQTARETVSGLLYVPASVVALLAAVLGVGGYVLTRRDVDIRRLLAAVVGLPGRIAAGGGRILVSVATNGDAVLAAFAGRLRRPLRVVADLGTGRATPAEAWRAGREWALGVRRRIGDVFGGLVPAGSDDRATEAMTVREAWRRFLETTSADTTATRTPAELATHAIEEDELPREPVEDLRDTFRAVEYGRREPSDRLDRVQNAVERIESARTERGQDR